MTLVSDMVKMTIVHYGGRAEFVAVDVEMSDGIKEYFLLNVLHQCDCLDAEASAAVIRYGLIFGFERLGLMEDRLDDVPIFLLPDNGQSVIFFRQDLADELMRFDCTGVSFIPPEECRMGV
jgi:hypothetical protein